MEDDIIPTEEEKEFLYAIADVSKEQLASFIEVMVTEYELQKDIKFRDVTRQDAFFLMLLALDVEKHKLIN